MLTTPLGRLHDVRARRSYNLASWRRREGLSIASAPYSPNYQEGDILSKPSASSTSSIHQIKQIHEPGGARRFVRRSWKWFVVNVITEVYGSLVGSEAWS
jgi:hypothetical protein